MKHLSIAQQNEYIEDEDQKEEVKGEIWPVFHRLI